MTVRPATEDDFAVCVNLVVCFLDEQVQPIGGYTVEHVARDVAGHIATNETFFFVVEDEGKLVGLCYGFLDLNPFNGRYFVHERLVYIKPQYRGMDLVPRFLHSIDEWAVKQHCYASIFSLTGSKNNQAFARLLTEKFGYKNIGCLVQKTYE